MDRKQNGNSIPSVEGLIGQNPWAAVQDLIGALRVNEADVLQLNLAGRHIFVFAVNEDPGGAAKSLNKQSHQVAAPPQTPEPSSGEVVQPSIEAIIAATCRRVGVTQKDILSKSRTGPSAVARCLIAHHASLAKLASLPETAIRLGRKGNSLYVGIARYKSVIPEFSMPLRQFLDPADPPSRKLQAVLGRRGWRTKSSADLADTEIGARIAAELS